jgi:hypothetical protein
MSGSNYCIPWHILTAELDKDVNIKTDLHPFPTLCLVASGMKGKRHQYQFQDEVKLPGGTKEMWHLH